MEARTPHASLWLALRFQKVLEILQVCPKLPPARRLKQRTNQPEEAARLSFRHLCQARTAPCRFLKGPGPLL
jgi:hypothetical protein